MWSGRKKGSEGEAVLSDGKCGENPSGSILHLARVVSLEVPVALSLDEVPEDLIGLFAPPLVGGSFFGMEELEVLLLVAWPSCVFPP